MNFKCWSLFCLFGVIFIWGNIVGCLANPLVLGVARTFPLIWGKSRGLVFFLFGIISLDVLQYSLFASSFAIEEDNFIYSDIVCIEEEKKAIPSYDNFLSSSCSFKNILSNTSSNIFYQNECFFVYIFFTDLFKYFFRFFFLWRKDEYIFPFLLGFANFLDDGIYPF